MQVAALAGIFQMRGGAERVDCIGFDAIYEIRGEGIVGFRAGKISLRLCLKISEILLRICVCCEMENMDDAAFLSITDTSDPISKV